MVADVGWARFDLNRASRTGDPEVVYGPGKTPEQVVAALASCTDITRIAPCWRPGFGEAAPGRGAYGAP